MDAIESARHFDCDAVKAYLKGGGNPHIFDKEGGNLMHALLYGYYSEYAFYTEEERNTWMNYDWCLEQDDDAGDSWCPHNSQVPLSERDIPIQEMIDLLLSSGVDVNAVCWLRGDPPIDRGDVETPLLLAVEYLDFFMTKYLLEHGADPARELFHDDFQRNGYEDYLIEDLDIALLHGAKGAAADNVLDIAAELLKHGLEKSTGGYCIEVDREHNTITGHSPRYLF